HIDLFGGSLGLAEAQTDGYVLSASFEAGACLPTSIGSCTISTCPPMKNPPVSAGDLAVSGGQLPQTQVLTYDPVKGYNVIEGKTRPFHSGDIVRFAADGSVLGLRSFSREIAAPSNVILTRPIYTFADYASGAEPHAIDRSINFSVEWITSA